MKKIISKILIIFILMVIMFEFTFSSNISYAQSIVDDNFANAVTNLMGGMASIILIIPKVMGVGIAWMLSNFMTENVMERCGITEAFTGTQGSAATPFDIFFNKYVILDVNFFDTTHDDEIVTAIRNNIAKWFYIMRLIASAVLLCVLIYVGIRMAISTVAEEKAKYKKMLFDWACSLALIYVLQYIVIFTIYANNAIVNFLRETIEALGNGNINSAVTEIALEALFGVGIQSLIATFVYFMIVFQTISFMIAYISRMLKVAFLIIISPLISLTYSIDKIGDGKAQALNTWLKEFVYTILIQPFHCVMYMAFANTAVGLLNMGSGLSGIAATLLGEYNQLTNGFLVILCFKFINDGEKAIRKIFNFQDDDSLTSMAAGAALSLAAVNQASKIGKSVATSVNKIKSLPTRFASALEKDNKDGIGKKLRESGDMLRNNYSDMKKSLEGTRAGKALNWAEGIAKGTGKLVDKGKGAIDGGINKFKASNTGQSLARKMKNAKDAAVNAGQRINDFNTKHKKTIDKVKSAGKFTAKVARQSMPATLALMGAAMSYATGTQGVMEAIGTGSAFKKGTEEFFEASQKTSEENPSNIIKNEAKKRLGEDYENEKEKIQKARDDVESANTAIKNIDSEVKEVSDGIPKEEVQRYKDVAQKQQNIDALRAQASEETDLTKRAELNAEADMEEADLASEKARIDTDDDLYRLYYKRAQEEAKKSEALYRESIHISKKKEMERKAVEKVMKQFKHAGGERQIAQAEVEILRIIAIAKSMKKAQEGDSTKDTYSEIELTDSEIDSSQRLQKDIVALAKLELMDATGDDALGKYVEDNFDGDEYMAQKLYAAIDLYKFHQGAAMVSDQKSKAKKYGLDGDKFDKDCERIATEHFN